MGTFHELHSGPTPLVLPNAWDVPSALAFTGAGFAAVGTTSFGVASSAGRPDGGRATREANIALARALSTLPVHVSMDIEDGYHDDPARVADYVVELTGANSAVSNSAGAEPTGAGPGVAGINIEDSSAERLIPAEAHAAKIAAIKERVPGLFVNARVDTYWLNQDADVDTTLVRAARYVEAGADGIFVPGASDPTVLRELTAAITVPVNVLVTPGRSLAELADLGVRRVSTGSLPYRAAIRTAVAVADAVRRDGALPEGVPYAELQARLTSYAQRDG